MIGSTRSVAMLGAIAAAGAVSQGKETGSGLPTAAYQAPSWSAGSRRHNRKAEVPNKTKRGVRRAQTRRRR